MSGAHMHCTDVRPRLVAREDGELARSEAALVAAHLERCPACTAAAAALAATRPAPSFVESASAREKRHLALDAALDAAFAELEAEGAPAVADVPSRRDAVGAPVDPVRGGSGGWRARAWGFALAAAALLAVGAYWSAAPTSSPVGAPEVARAGVTRAMSQGVLPADQFRAAAYRPASGAVGGEGSAKTANEGAVVASPDAR